MARNELVPSCVKDAIRHEFCARHLPWLIDMLESTMASMNQADEWLVARLLMITLGLHIASTLYSSHYFVKFLRSLDKAKMMVIPDAIMLYFEVYTYESSAHQGENLPADPIGHTILQLLAVVLTIQVNDVFVEFDKKHRATLVALLDRREREKSLDAHIISETRKYLLVRSTHPRWTLDCRDQLSQAYGWQKCAYPPCSVEKCSYACMRRVFSFSSTVTV